MFHKIMSVNALPGYRLRVQFAEGVTKIYDVKPLFSKWASFETLKDDLELFSCVEVDVGGYGVIWNDDLDLACDELFENGKAVKEIRIQYDYMHGPLWKDKFDPEPGAWSTGVSCIDDDETLQQLNAEAQALYESLFSFEPGNSGCRLDESRFSEVQGRLNTLAEAIADRLDAINDGSFTVRREIDL